MSRHERPVEFNAKPGSEPCRVVIACHTRSRVAFKEPRLLPTPGEREAEGAIVRLCVADLGRDASVATTTPQRKRVRPRRRRDRRSPRNAGQPPVIIRDACGAGDEVASEGSLESLAFMGDAIQTDIKTLSGSPSLPRPKKESGVLLPKGVEAAVGADGFPHHIRGEGAP